MSITISTWQVTILDSYYKANNTWDVDGLVTSMYTNGYEQKLQGGSSTSSEVYIWALEYSQQMDTLLELVTLNTNTAFLENIVPIQPQYYPDQRPYGILSVGKEGTHHDKKGSHKLAGWKVALIVIFVLIGVGAIVGVVFFILKRRRDRQHYVEL